MAKYNLTIDIIVEADNEDEARAIGKDLIYQENPESINSVERLLTVFVEEV